MAKRGRKPQGISIDSLMFELGRLEARRREIAAQIRDAVSAVAEFEAPLQRRAEAMVKTVVKTMKRTRKAMSAESRAKISAAQKARWAKSKKTANSLKTFAKKATAGK